MQSAAPVARPPAESSAASATPIWWWAVPAVLLLLGAATFLLLRRRIEEPEAEDVFEAVQPEPQPAARPVPVAAPAPRPVSTPVPAAAPTPAAAAADPLEISFEPVGLRLSLVFATLQYRIVVTAKRDLPAGHLLGDIIGAHGTLSQEAQLAPAPETLAVLKPLPALAAGESATLSGDVQIALGAIRALERGGARLFVPLLRLCLTFGDAVPALRRVYTLGLTGGPALAPLRLDTGPREHRDLAAREIEAARAYPVHLIGHPVAAGG